jgi:hypothetical protein
VSVPRADGSGRRYGYVRSLDDAEAKIQELFALSFAAHRTGKLYATPIADSIEQIEWLALSANRVIRIRGVGLRDWVTADRRV